MAKPKRDNVSTEAFVWRVLNEFEDRVNGRFEQMDKKFDKMMEAVLDIASKFGKLDEEREMIVYRQKGHEDRIQKLEKTVFKTS